MLLKLKQDCIELLLGALFPHNSTSRNRHKPPKMAEATTLEHACICIVLPFTAVLRVGLEYRYFQHLLASVTTTPTLRRGSPRPKDSVAAYCKGKMPSSSIGVRSYCQVTYQEVPKNEAQTS